MASGVTTAAQTSATNNEQHQPHHHHPNLQQHDQEPTQDRIAPSTFDNQFFYEDEVFKIDKKGRVKFGVVTDNSDTFYSDIDSDEDDVLSKGEIRVLWHPDGKEEVLAEEVVGLADRTLMPGDVVRRLVAGKDTQRGYCREINMKADVKIVGTKFVVQKIDAERLKPVNMPNDNAVCLDSWVGSTKEVEEFVTLRSACGAVFDIPDYALIDMVDANSKSRSEIIPSNRCFYPGQVLAGRLGTNDQMKYANENITLKKNKKGQPISKRFIVQKVDLVAVHVHWQCKALSEEDAAEIKTNVLQQPPTVIKGDDLKRLKRLNLFEACTLQINDKNLLKISECDSIVKKSAWEGDQAFKYKLFLKQQNKAESTKQPKSVVKTSATPQYDKLKSKLSNTNLDVTDIANKFGPKAKVTYLLTKSNLEKFNSPPPSIYPVKIVLPDDQNVEASGGGTADTKEDWQTEDEMEFLLNEEDEEDGDEESSCACGSSTTTTVSTCSTPTPKSSPKRIRLQKKQVKKLRKSVARSSDDVRSFPPPGEQVVTEALVVYSSAVVVWQDGTVEKDILSTELYPIHHLDDHEFFPGDFVLSGKEESSSTYRDYGVIQSVDHQGRTAEVKWFTTYTAIDDPKPTYKGETEESVYDLKDHPDFQYRPGTIVIRVANFVGEDANCTAGQIIDNFKDGRIKVWWVDGHISMSWPQDLFEVAHVDDTQDFWGGNNESDDSWETESEISDLGGGGDEDEDKSMKRISELVTNLERALAGFKRLEALFNSNPTLQSKEVMRKLLQLYKVCRFIDKLTDSTFFHEDNFMGLLERVRKKSSPEESSDKLQLPSNTSPQVSPKSGEYSPKVWFNVSSTPFRNKSTSTNPATKSSGDIAAIVVSTLTCPEKTITTVSYDKDVSQQTQKDFDSSIIITESSPMSACNQEKNRLLTSVMMNMEKVVEKSTLLKLNSSSNSTSQDDSGNCSRNDICDVSSNYASSNDLATTGTSNSNQLDGKLGLLQTTGYQKSVSNSSIELTDDDSVDYIAARLCNLMLSQLAEIQKKYVKSNPSFAEKMEYQHESEEENIGWSKESATNPDTPNTPAAPQSESCDSITTTTICDVNVSIAAHEDAFQLLPNAPSSHKYHLAIFHTTNSQEYYKSIQREHKALHSGLPPGVWVRTYEDRLDLFSVMIEGPANTPYEDGMFFFDIQLGKDYPKTPPLCHYISYCTDRLNPNLYEDGKVCVSLLGTWSGRDTEVWGSNSTLLQVIVSIQGLILVAEPYFNEAGYDKQKGTQHGFENSRMYNEMVIIKLVQAMGKLVQSPPEIFKEQVLKHFSIKGENMYNRIKHWMELSKASNSKPTTPAAQDVVEDNIPVLVNGDAKAPDFPLIPASRGFCLTLVGQLENFMRKIRSIKLEKSVESPNVESSK